MKSTLTKRSVVIGAHKTSVSLENEFWEGLKEIARSKQSSLSELLSIIDSQREQTNLSSAIRVFILKQYRRE